MIDQVHSPAELDINVLAIFAHHGALHRVQCTSASSYYRLRSKYRVFVLSYWKNEISATCQDGGKEQQGLLILHPIK